MSVGESFYREAWAAWIGTERDGDGQPTHIHVCTTTGAHVVESDLEHIRALLRQPPTLTLDEAGVERLAAALPAAMQATGWTISVGAGTSWQAIARAIIERLR